MSHTGPLSRTVLCKNKLFHSTVYSILWTFNFLKMFYFFACRAFCIGATSTFQDHYWVMHWLTDWPREREIFKDCFKGKCCVLSQIFSETSSTFVWNRQTEAVQSQISFSSFNIFTGKIKCFQKETIKELHHAKVVQRFFVFQTFTASLLKKRKTERTCFFLTTESDPIITASRAFI